MWLLSETAFISSGMAYGGVEEKDGKKVWRVCGLWTGERIWSSLSSCCSYRRSLPLTLNWLQVEVWTRYRNAKWWQCETASTFRDVSLGWNAETGNWLRKYVS